MNTNDLANRLKFLRAKANYTQSYVCSKIHLSRSSYSNYENGLRVPPLDILKLLAEFYDTSLDYLVGMTDCPEKYPFASAENVSPLCNLPGYGLPGTERSLILCLLQKTDGKTLSHFFYNLLLL